MAPLPKIVWGRHPWVSTAKLTVKGHTISAIVSFGRIVGLTWSAELDGGRVEAGDDYGGHEAYALAEAAIRRIAAKL